MGATEWALESGRLGVVASEWAQGSVHSVTKYTQHFTFYKQWKSKLFFGTSFPSYIYQCAGKRVWTY